MRIIREIAFKSKCFERLIIFLQRMGALLRFNVMCMMHLKTGKVICWTIGKYFWVKHKKISYPSAILALV